jgi:hypothetical protein
MKLSSGESATETEKKFNHKGHKDHKVGARFIAPSDGRRGSFNRKERRERKKKNRDL